MSRSIHKKNSFKMKSNIGKIAFASFQRKANQLRARLVRGENHTISFEDSCEKQDKIYIWSWEKGFDYATINDYSKTGKQLKLGLVVAHIIDVRLTKKDDAILPSHLGIYDKEKGELHYFSILRIPGIHDKTEFNEPIQKTIESALGVNQLQKIFEEYN